MTYLSAIVGILMIAFGIVFFFYIVPYEQSESGLCGKEFPIAITYISSLSSDKNVDGSFVLGMGGIHTARVYVAYTGSNGTGYVLLERPAAESFIFKDTNSNPFVEEFDVMRCTGGYCAAGSAGSSGSFDIMHGMCTVGGYTVAKKYNFHVPEGTIIMEYSV